MKPEVRWPLFIISLLVLQVAVGVFFVWKATSDPSFAVEEDYYNKAVNWEAAQAQAQHNQELGWVIAETFLPPKILGADPTLEVRLTDVEGKPITGALLQVEAFHNVRAGHILRATLDERGPGVYAAQLPMFRSGLWELRYTVDHAETRFTHISKTHLEARGP
jgi:nitrogen fixation protein FixH